MGVSGNPELCSVRGHLVFLECRQPFRNRGLPGTPLGSIVYFVFFGCVLTPLVAMFAVYGYIYS